MIFVQPTRVQHQPSSCSARVEDDKIISTDRNAFLTFEWQHFEISLFQKI